MDDEVSEEEYIDRVAESMCEAHNDMFELKDDFFRVHEKIQAWPGLHPGIQKQEIVAAGVCTKQEMHVLAKFETAQSVWSWSLMTLVEHALNDQISPQFLTSRSDIYRFFINCKNCQESERIIPDIAEPWTTIQMCLEWGHIHKMNCDQEWINK